MTWGIIPDTRQRLPFEQRWPMIAEARLNASGLRVRIVDDCLNGRRTIWQDPFKPGRNGLEGLAQRIEINSPLSLVVLMLGCNDFQFCHPFNDAWAASQGIATLVNEIRKAPIEPGMPSPPILIVCPPRITTPNGTLFLPKFRGSEQRVGGLGEAYHAVAIEQGCDFFDAETVCSTSPVDGIHLDAEAHFKLGEAMAPVIRGILSHQG